MIAAGLCSVTMRAQSAQDVIDVAAGAGLAAIEWGGDVHVPPGDDALAREVGDRTRDAGIAVASYGSYLRAGRSTPADVAAALDAAVALGAPNVRVWAPRTTPWDEAVDALRALCADAGERGLTVSTEHHGGTWTEDVASSTALRGEVGADNLFTYWQPLSGRTTDDHVGEVLDLAPGLSHLHVFCWCDDGTRLPLADGADLWGSVLAGVAKVSGRWTGPRVAFLEFVPDDDPGHVAREAAVLRGWLEAM